ncbi:chaperonin 10-like protein [Bisporella sp. PMI_857]|nr:chaperonin 10-like protein [Bisporella sp. PMI_857]
MMIEAINLPGPKVKLIRSPIPEPNNGQVLVKVVVSGSNPKDWKVPDTAASYDGPGHTLLGKSKPGMNQGDDIAGIIEKVGPGVIEFKVGDRVAAFHEIGSPGGSYAEYALAWSWTTFHLPDETSFEEAATIPLAGLTAAIALYRHLDLPPPWNPADTTIPLVVYGASTAVGSFAIKLAKNSNIHPIFAIAGKGAHYVETLLDRTKGDMVIDYRNGPEEAVKQIRNGLEAGNEAEVKYGLECGIGPQSARIFKDIIAPGGLVNLVLPSNFDVSPAVKSLTAVGAAHNHVDFGDSRDLAFVFSRYFSRALQHGTFSGHPFEVRPDGLEGVEQALRDLKDGQASAVKYIFRISDTPGI